MVFINTNDSFYKTLNNHILCLNEIEQYIFNLVNRLELESYIVGVDYIEEDGLLGSYSFDDEIIKLNVPRIIPKIKSIIIIMHIRK